MGDPFKRIKDICRAYVIWIIPDFDGDHVGFISESIMSTDGRRCYESAMPVWILPYELSKIGTPTSASYGKLIVLDIYSRVSPKMMSVKSPSIEVSLTDYVDVDTLA